MEFFDLQPSAVVPKIFTGKQLKSVSYVTKLCHQISIYLELKSRGSHLIDITSRSQKVTLSFSICFSIRAGARKIKVEIPLLLVESTVWRRSFHSNNTRFRI